MSLPVHARTWSCRWPTCRAHLAACRSVSSKATNSDASRRSPRPGPVIVGADQPRGRPAHGPAAHQCHSAHSRHPWPQNQTRTRRPAWDSSQPVRPGTSSTTPAAGPPAHRQPVRNMVAVQLVHPVPAHLCRTEALAERQRSRWMTDPYERGGSLPSAKPAAGPSRSSSPRCEPTHRLSCRPRSRCCGGWTPARVARPARTSSIGRSSATFDTVIGAIWPAASSRDADAELVTELGWTPWRSWPGCGRRRWMRPPWPGCADHGRAAVQ